MTNTTSPAGGVGIDRETEARIDWVDEPDCPRCGAAGRLLHRELVDRSFGVAGRWSLRECQPCELVWIDPHPTPSCVGSLYRSYFTHTRPAPDGWLRRIVHRSIPMSLGHGPASATEVRLGRLFGLLGPLRELAQQSVLWLPPERHGRLLDVGCGAGSLLERMRDFGWQVRGIEADAAAAQVASELLGDGIVHLGSLDDASFDAGSFDAISLFHVVEHLLDPARTLRACHRLLRPGGRLVVATPNTLSIGRRRFGPSWLHWDPPRHVRLYSPRSLTRIVKEAGFGIHRVMTPSTSADPVWRASRIIRDEGRLPGMAIDRDVRGTLGGLLFWAREYMLTWLGQPCGEDVVIIADRPAAPGTAQEEARLR